MLVKPFDVVAFDADDTLWHNERTYRGGRERFRALLERAGMTISDEEIEAHVTRTELDNIQYFGYGVSSFALSLIESAVDLTGGRVSAGDLRGIIDLAKQMLSEEIELFPDVRDTLAAVAGGYPLMLITKGDLLHQTSKLERSGLRDLFAFVEVVSHKTPDVYASILSRHGVEPGRFLMVGNSLRSDILPAIEAGGWAAYVPAALTWSHDHAELPETARGRYFELAGLADVLTLLRTFEESTAVPRSREWR